MYIFQNVVYLFKMRTRISCITSLLQQVGETKPQQLKVVTFQLWILVSNSDEAATS